MKTKSAGAHKPPNARIPRTRKPDNMSLEEWQIALRREFGRQQKFRLKNIGREPVFSEFHVTNPQTRKTYRVAIRGVQPGDNFCSCPDFAVNTLGTCKHVEFTLAKLERQRGGKAALRAGYAQPYSEIYLRYGAKHEVAFKAGTECPAAVRRLVSRYFDAQGFLRPESYSSFEELVARANRNGHEVRCYPDALSFVAQVRDRERLAGNLRKAFPRGPGSAAFHKLVKGSLYLYQKEGALFAARAGRCLLADEMGLGKTIQALAATEILTRTTGVERVLIVCPTSLKHQWQQEIAKFTNRTAEVIYGQLAARAAGYARPSFYKITNYEVVHRDLDAIRKWAPDLVILDEAQRIKNWKTRTARTIKQLPGEYAIVLTGTPLENRLEELHSIIEFVDRFRLGPLFRFLDEHQQVDENGRVVGYRDLGRIAQTLESLLLRRTKDGVLKELPERLEKRLFLPMTPEQWQHHEENKEIVAKIVAKWRRYGFLTEKDQLRLMIALQNMRMSCNSTYLLDQTTDFGRKADEAATLMGEVLESEGTKAVVFSQWLRTHELLQARFARRKWDHVLFHGGVPGPKRKDLVQRFREDPRCRAFLSTDAGGVGLNLQHASVVFNMDLPWNPAVLEQRIGRVHRLGQRQPVHVYHFIAENTIEHGMLSVLSFKKALFAGVLDGGQDEVFFGGTRLKKFMESVEKDTGAIPADGGLAGPAETPASEEEEAEIEEERPTTAPAAVPAPPPAPAPAPSAPEAASQPEQRAQQAWAEVLSSLGRLFAGLQAAPGGAGRGEAAAGQPVAGIERDEKTGQAFLKLPIQEPEKLEALAQALKALTGN